MPRQFSRVAIVNRGEPAMRFIRAVREFNAERGTQIRSLVFYTSPDWRARFVREADEAFALDDPASPGGSARETPPYLDLARIKRALKLSNADAAWVGWGFVAERPDFADLCADLGITLIGPDSRAMRLLGDKISAKRLAERLGIPVIPWAGQAAPNLDAARDHARELGYPVVIKAAAGEGGRGIRRVDSESGLSTAFEAARREAQRIFGHAEVYVEKWLSGVRHVEVQILADHYGTIWAVGTRDCTIQRRHQKLMEEAPATILTPGQESGLRQAAVRLAGEASYRNAGTLEFLYDPVARECAFMEVNTRLQVEHPVTELTTGLDLVKMQLHIALGGKLAGDPPAQNGHAIEVRLCAEDSEAGFAAAPGTLSLFRMPTRAGLRLDSGVTEGDPIPAEYDSMFAKLISCAASRREALAGLGSALIDCSAVVAGGKSNRTFLLRLVGSREILENTVDVTWLDRGPAVGIQGTGRLADVALLQAAVEVYDLEAENERELFLASAARMRPVVRSESGRAVELRLRGHSYRFVVYRTSLQQYRVDVDGTRVEVAVDRSGKFERWITAFGRRYRAISVVDGLSHWVEVCDEAYEISRDEEGVIRAPAPSVVVAVNVKPGARVVRGERLALLEAMKMEMPVLAPFAGTVREVFVLSNSQVAAGSQILRLDSTETEKDEVRAARVSFASSPAGAAAPDPAERACAILGELRRFMLGSDMDPADTKRLITEYNDVHRQLAADDHRLLGCEDQILSIFADVSSLFRRQATPEDPEDNERVSAGEYMLTYLRSIEARGAGLPQAFVTKLRKTLAHYGSDGLDPTPELKGRLLWIYKSHSHIEQQVPVIVAILERRLTHAQALTCCAGPEFLAVLERLITSAENRFPALGDAARESRYRFFEQPLFDKARADVLAKMKEHFECLLLTPSKEDRAGRMKALVDCPYPLMGVLAGHLSDAHSGTRQFALEVLTRRYYRARSLASFRTISGAARSFAVAEYRDEGRKVHLVSTHAEGELLNFADADFRTILEKLPPHEDVVVDLYAWQPDLPADPGVLPERIRLTLRQASLCRPIVRILVAISSSREPPAASGTLHYTFCPSDSGYEEETTYRGIHPMMTERLQLWRLRNFNLERLPSADDVYLFRCVARENPKDQRLFAVAEVRDLTPVRDAAGCVVQLPHLERMLMETLAAIRQEQFRRAPEERLHWNRVLLYVYPPVTLTPEELQPIARRLARQTEGLGLEKVVLSATIVDPKSGAYTETALSISNPGGRGIVLRFAPPSDQPLRPLTEYVQKVVRMRQRQLNYPYEVIQTLTPESDAGKVELPPGEFTEMDLDEHRRLVPVARPYGTNTANVVVGLIRNFTAKHPEGMTRVILLGDPSKELGSIAEPECRRILAALDLAESMNIPLEWYTLSAGAKISMQSGTENMDWIALVLRRLIEFTQAGGEVNVIVAGINVGAQPYWNAEATMLMHTRGILVMMPESAMVLTGKTALDYSGSVSADDNLGIGGYERVMGPNGQAQYWAQNLAEACRILMRHYEHTYVAPGERFPRNAVTCDPPSRDVRLFPHTGAGEEFAAVGEVFSDERNPGRKKPFDIRSIMLAVTDQDHPPLERWPGMLDAEVAVVWDAHIGGVPVCLMGFESRSVPRVGFVATDGPEQWTSGTLFPMASKKVARAVNACSANRPLVILANLSGFDGSPESMRRRQLEYGAEIGRAVVNFKGPIVFCVISRYHGGAFVVFSRVLNENMEVAALEGTYASVIGGAPAAAVVFAREVDNRTRKDPRVAQAEAALAAATEADKRGLRVRLAELRKVVRSEKLGEVAEEFDHIHSVHRALQVGSLDRIIPAPELRPYLIDAIRRGMERELDRWQKANHELHGTTLDLK